MGKNKVLRIDEVCALVSMSRATIYRLIGKNQFPNQIKISERRVGFRLIEVLEWIETR